MPLLPPSEFSGRKREMKISDKDRMDYLSKTPGYGPVALRVWNPRVGYPEPWCPPANGVRRAIDAAIRASRRRAK
jgi:hypothetical protein